MSAAPALPVGIVVLNWRNHAASSRCLRSLAPVARPAHRVYVLDNASGDGSMERLRAEFGGTGPEFLQNEANLGFAAGCNVGIRRALEDGCGSVLLLNNDCIVDDPEFLVHGAARLASDPRCGIVGGKILFWPETGRLWSTGGFIRFWGGERHLGHRELDHGQFDQPAERTFISGALMLIRREVFERIGPLPEAYFFGKEEWEFSRRAHRAGFRLLYEPAFRVLHEASNSHDWYDPAYAYNGHLSRILYKRRNLHPLAWALWNAAFTAYARWVFPLRYRLRPATFRSGVSAEALHAALRDALADARGLERITEQTLDAFRRRHPDLMRRPGPPAASSRA